MIPLSGLLGIQYAVTDSIVWEAGVAIGMNKAAPDFRLTIGLTLLFKPYPSSYLFKIFLAGLDLDIQHIFSWRKRTDKFFVIGAGGIIGHIKI